MKFPFQSNTPLSAYPYNSRIAKSEFSTTQPAKNNILHGFVPGNALQASELNEIQENFYKNLTLHNYLLRNWIFIGSSDFTSGNTDPVYGPSWIGAVPFHPFNSIRVIDNTITFKKAWYLVDDFSGIKFWIYNNTEYIFTYTPTVGEFIGIKLEKKYITAADDPTLFDNSSGFSNSSLSPGADRYQLNIIDVYQSATQQTNITTNENRDVFKIASTGSLRYINNLVHKNQ